MWVAVAVGTCAVAEPVADGLLAAPKTLPLMAGRTSQIAVSAFERIRRHLGVVERFDFERLRRVTCVAGTLRLAQTELTCVHVAMTTRALTRGTAIGPTMTTQTILLRRPMTAVTRGLGVRACERPRAVVDAGGVPPALGVAVRTATRVHLRRKLITMRVVVAIGASHGGELEVGAGAFPSMAARARHGLVPPLEWETCSSVLLHGEGRGPEAMLVVTARAVGLAERPPMGVAVTVVALVELKLAVSTLQRELGRMAPLTGHVAVHPFEREARLRMRAEADGARKLQPTDAGVAALTSIPEGRFVDLLVTRDTGRTGARGHYVSSIVACLALGLRMPARQAQAGVVASYVGNLAPIGLVVTRGALGTLEPAFVGILVTRYAVGLQSEERRITAPVAAIVAVLALNGSMRPFEHPAGQSMIESVRSSARPPDELGVRSQVLHMAFSAILSAILAPVKAGLLPDSTCKVVMAGKTGIGIEPFSRRVALAAVGVAFDVGMSAAQLPWRKELCARPPRHDRPEPCSCDDHETQDERRCDSPAHSEKIQRYP